MKKLSVFVLVMAVAAFCFTGCTVKSQLEGTRWRITSMTYTNGISESDISTDTFYCDFMKNGICTFTEVSGLFTKLYDGTWSGSGKANRLTIAFDRSLYGQGTCSSTGTVKVSGNTLNVSGLSLPAPWWYGYNIASFTAIKAL